ncbi:chaperone modulator CbpM [Undibacterium sp. RuRC25W]|uniref:chaperone modulator CbpM n=1 Tax=Undibacterium sp. RuRC25W TaxID=3413047 RepID=UPI003BF002C1
MNSGLTNEKVKSVCNAYYLMEVSGLSEIELDALIEHKLLTPINDAEHSEKHLRTGETLHFALHAVFFTTSARRLRDDFELDCNGLIMALTLIRQIDTLSDEIRWLNARLPSPVC